MRNCDRCGRDAGNDIYLGDWFSGIVFGDTGESIDLCKFCSDEIIKIVKDWWDNKRTDQK